jgi:hypothetical protein
MIAFCAEIAGIAGFRGYSCLAQIVDNFNDGKLNPLISEVEFGWMVVVIAAVWNFISLSTYLVLWIKYRILRQQQPHYGGEADPFIRQ